MPKTATINIHIEPEIKEQAEQLYSQFGITITDAVSLFIHQSLIDGGIPFSIKAKQPNAETIAAMDDVNQGKNLHGPFYSVEELMEELNA